MQFKLSAVLLTTLLSSNVLAGWNCKCQTTSDKNGIQYNDRTESVCRLMKGEKRDEINSIAGSVGGAASAAALAIVRLPLPKAFSRLKTQIPTQRNNCKISANKY